ncbi:MAG: fimbrial biogenesis outer membrane usher protein [Hyphomicrobiaceae bacterium]|nr:fimbrial biogenesis outer membrane usher protein [Hyphomicrobiaceae bacterium]
MKRVVTTWRLARITAVATLAGAVAPLAAAPVALAARDGGATEYAFAKPVSTKLNTTGRRIHMPVPFKDETAMLGELVIVINPDDSVLVPKAALVNALTPVFDKAALERLHGVRDADGQVTIQDLRAAGFDVRFDPAQMQLVLHADPDQRPVGDLSLARRRGPDASANVVLPAKVSGYLNVNAGFDYLWGDATGNEDTATTLDFESVFRFWNVVVENEATFETGASTFVCPVSARCLFDHAGGFKRRRSRVVYDMPDSQLRVQAGDADVYGTSFQRAPDVLGVTVEKSPRKLKPGENIRPTGKSSFRIERPSDIDVMVNGAVIQRLRLRAGNYNLSDLPLGTGANEIQLVITDDTGERRALAFTTFFDGNLLGAGRSEWSVSGGVPSYFEDNRRIYRDDEYFGSGFLRYGLTDMITGEAHVQGDKDVVMGGLGVFAATPWGFLGVQGAMSNAPSGLGWAAEINYDLVNFAGPLAYYTGARESLRLGAEYRSPDFRAPGEFLDTAGGILLPQFDYWLRLTAQYSTPLWNSVSMTIGARYQFADDDAIGRTPLTLKGDRYGIDLTLTSPLTDWATGSLTVGYSNESYLLADTRNGNDQADFRVMARLFVRPDDTTRIAATYDSLNQEAYVSAYRGHGRGIDRFEETADLQKNGNDDRATASGSVAYYGNRGEIRAAHSSGFNGVTWDNFNARPADQRSTVRVGSSLVFADGAFGVGQPIRGNGFAIVKPHESISDKTVSVGGSGDVRARTDWLGAAVVPDVPAYTKSTIPVDVADLPIGYSLGSGAFDTYAPYKAGYKLEVGSAYSVSTYGKLLKADGQPVALLTGIARPADNPSKEVVIFTNASGKFGAEGLAPGRWTITMATEDAPTVYELDVPEGTDGLFKAGDLKPARNG